MSLNNKFRTSASLITLGLLAACGPSRYGNDTVPERLSEYKGVFKVGNPYEVSGKTYYPAFNEDYDETGIASWYGPGFHGKRTANGEKFDTNGITAAHATLPLPSIVRVTNLENDRTVDVKINDRGPFKDGRIIDLSKGAANSLGIGGTAKVRVQYLRDDSEQLWASLNMKDSVRQEYAMRARSPRAGAAPEAIQNMEVASLSTTNSRAVGSSAPVSEVASSELAPLTAPKEKASAKVTKTQTTETVTQEREIASAEPVVTTSESTTSTEQMVWKSGKPALNASEASYTYVSKPEAESSDNDVFIQAGAFSVKENAYSMASTLSKVAQANVMPIEVNNKTMFRVRLGPFNGQADAKSALSQVVAMGNGDAKIIGY